MATSSERSRSMTVEAIVFLREAPLSSFFFEHAELQQVCERRHSACPLVWLDKLVHRANRAVPQSCEDRRDRRSGQASFAAELADRVRIDLLRTRHATRCETETDAPVEHPGRVADEGRKRVAVERVRRRPV